MRVDAHKVVGGRAVVKAVQNSGVTGEPDDLTDADERRLIEGLLQAAAESHPTDGLVDDLAAVAHWPEWTDTADGNPSGFALDLEALNPAAGEDHPRVVIRIPAADHAAALNAGTAPPPVRDALAAVVRDDAWRTADDVEVMPRPADMCWRVRRTGGPDSQRFSIVRDGNELKIIVGLSPCRGSLLADNCALPAPGTVTNLVTALIEITPPARTEDDHEYGLCLVSEFEDPTQTTFEIRELALTRFTGEALDDNGPMGGLRLRLLTPRTVTLNLLATERVGQVVDAPGAEGIERPVFVLDPAEDIPTLEPDWPVDPSPLLDPGNVVSVHSASVRVNGLRRDEGQSGLRGEIRLLVSLAAAFFDSPMELAFASAGDTGADPPFKTFQDDGGGLKFPQTSLTSLLPGGWPFPRGLTPPFGLRVGNDNGLVAADFNGHLPVDEGHKPRLDLGSPLTQLTFESPVDLVLGLKRGLDLAIPEGPAHAGLAVDLFAQPPGQQVVINHLWESMGAAQDFGRLFQLKSPEGGVSMPEARTVISWVSRSPLVDAGFLAELLNLSVDSNRRLRSLSGDALGKKQPTLVNFASTADRLPIRGLAR